MAIQSVSEFEAVINHVVARIEKELVERGSVPALEVAIRDLQHIYNAARSSAKLKPLRGLLEKVTDLLGEQIPDDSALVERLWDLADYVDYRA
jgi:hypothetical protein